MIVGLYDGYHFTIEKAYDFYEKGFKSEYHPQILECGIVEVSKEED